MSNFKYAYNRSKTISTNQLGSASKSELLREAKRLSGLVKTRQKQLEKRGYSSYALKKLEIQQEQIKRGTFYENSPLSVSKNFSERMLMEMIRSYDVFLTSKTSTWEQIEERTELELNKLTQKQKDAIKRIELNLGRDLTSKDWARINFVLDNSDNVSKLFDIIPSEQIISAIANSDFNPQTIIDRIEMFMNTSHDDYNINTIRGIIGDVSLLKT